MPTPLPIVNLGAFTVGSSGTIDLSNCAPTSNPNYVNQTATLQIYNESAAGLRFNGVSKGNNFDLPAGGWANAAIDPGEVTLSFTVIYLLPNPSVSVLMATYFAPNESVPPPAASLGNSPVNIGNAVPVSTAANSVTNDGNATPTTFIESTPSGGAQSWKGTNDGGLTLSPLSNATQPAAFQVVPGGGAGVFAVVKMDAAAIATDGQGDIVKCNTITVTKALGGAGQPFFELHPSDQPTFKFALEMSSSGNLVIQDEQASTATAIFASGGGGGLKLTGLGNFVTAWSFFSGNATGTYSHGLGTTPNVVLINASAAGSETIGWDSPTSTQVHITNGDGVAWTALALKMV